MRSARRPTSALLPLAVLLVLGACSAPRSTQASGTDDVGEAFGSSASVESSSATPDVAAGAGMGDPTAVSTGGCALTVTGDHTTTIAGGSVASDHWLTSEEVSRAHARTPASTADGDPTGSAAPDDASPEPAAGTAPIFNWLVISCGEEGGEGFRLLANDEATAQDVPFAPGEYQIAPGFLSATEDRTQFSAIVDVGAPGRMFALTAGTVTITGFDENGVRGTVSMHLERSPQDGEVERARLTGSFELPCSGGDLCRAVAQA